MSADLFPDLPQPPKRYTVTVTVPQPVSGRGALLPPEHLAVVQLAAVAVAADSVMSAWTCSQTVVSMVVDALSRREALAAGAAVAEVLDSGTGAVTVTAEPVPGAGSGVIL